jgi:hypothetical protein
MERPTSWKAVGLWAVDRLEERLGAEWPVTAWEKFGRLPAGISYSVSHTAAYVELVELALRLELCQFVNRFPSVQRTLASNPNEDEVQHLRLQLEVAALAKHAGHGIEFEPPVSFGPKRADIELSLPGRTPVLVETRVILMPGDMRAIQQFSDDVFIRLRTIASRYGLICEGEVGQLLDTEETDAFLADVDRHARLIAKGISMPPFRSYGAALTFKEAGSEGGALKGPSIEGDLWHRFAARLVEKAEQTRGAKGVWLRFDARQGLWQFTKWALEGLPAKTVWLHHNVAVALADYPHVAGVVVTPGAVLGQGTFVDEDYDGLNGAFGLRRLIAPLRVRETLVIPLATDDDAMALSRAWRDLYAFEPAWLDDALGRFGLPTSAEIFADPIRGASGDAVSAPK